MFCSVLPLPIYLCRAANGEQQAFMWELYRKETEVSEENQLHR